MPEENLEHSRRRETTGSSRSAWKFLANWAPWLLVLWPAWALYRLIREYGINAPFLDDYMSMPLFEKAARGGLQAHDFFAAQMEHRIAWVRVVQLLFHKLWPGHCFIAQVWYNWVLLGLTLVNVAILLRQTMNRPLRACWPALALASLCLFSPVQFNIILWAFMHQVVTLAFFLTTALVVWQTRWPVAVRLVLSLLCALLGTLSFTAGILIWLVLLPVIGWCAPLPPGHTRLRVMGVWLLAFAVTLGLYFHHLKNEVGATYAMGQGEQATLGRDLRAFAEDPLKAAVYTARLLGNPLVRGNTSDLMQSSLRMGIVLLAAYALILGWWLWRFRDRDLRRRLLPWLALGGYSIGAAVAITMGRVWLGATGAYALSTRYVIHAAPLLVALPALAWLVADDLGRRFPPAATFLSKALAVAGAALAMLELTAWTYGENMMEAWSSSRKRGAASTLFFKTRCVVENDYPDGPTSDCILADELHLLKPPMLKNLRLENFTIFPHPLNEVFSVWDSLHVEHSDGVLHGIARGRAILKKHWRVADAIVLAYRAADGHWEIFHVTHVTGLPLYFNGVIVRDLEFMHQPTPGIHQHLSSFAADFRLDELPPGKWTVAAWAYDYDERHLSLIPGFFELETASGAVRPLGNDAATVQLADYVKSLRKTRQP